MIFATAATFDCREPVPALVLPRSLTQDSLSGKYGSHGCEIEFEGYEQDQDQSFPARLSDALDAGDPAFFINDFVEGLDLVAFEARYAVAGERAYSPRVKKNSRI